MEVKSFAFWQVVERIQLLFVMVVIMLQILNLMEETYKKIYTNLGLDFRVVEADSGAIGGS